MSAEYVRAVRAPDTTFKACGFRGCTSFASHVLRIGRVDSCFVCAQCAAVGVKANVDLSGDAKVFAKAAEQLLGTGFASAPVGMPLLPSMRRA